jgi:carbonic anhydrase
MNKPKEIGLALSCIDYRLFDATIELLKKSCCVDAFDHFILAGASLGFNQDEYKNWPPALINHIDLAIQLHHIKKIVVIDHEDCGAYKLFYPCLKHHPHKEREYHIFNVKKFIKQMKKLYPDMLYSGFILNLDGTAEKVYQDKCK